jgi:hypothetical protein
MANSSASTDNITGPTGISVFHPIHNIMPATFTNKTWIERTAAGPITHVYSRFANTTKCIKGTITTLFNSDTDTCIGICQLAGPFERNTDSIYSNPIYNKFRAPLAWIYLFPVSIPKSKIEEECSMTVRFCNSFIYPRDSFATPRYYGENETLVKTRFEALVAKWVIDAKESMIPKKVAIKDNTQYWHYSM